MDVLNEADNKKMMAEYDKWIRAANSQRPPGLTKKELEGKTPEERNAILKKRAEEIAAFDSNPGTLILNKIYSDVAALGYDFDSRTGRFVGTDADTANAEVERRLAENKKAYEKGLKDGKGGDFSKAFEHFGRLEFMEGIKEALKAIPIIGDLLIVPGKIIKRLFTTGKFLNPIEAYKEARYERALGGALSAINMPADKIDQFASMAINGTVPEPAVVEKPKDTKAEGEKPKKDTTPKVDLKAGVVTAALKPDDTIADELQSIKVEGLRGKLVRDNFLVMVGDTQDIYVMTKRGDDLVIDGLFAKGKDGSYAAKTTSLKGTTVRTNSASDNTLETADLKKMDEDSKLTRMNSGEILPESTAVAGSIDKPVPEILTDALKRLGADKVIPDAMKKVAEQNKTPEVVIVHDVEPNGSPNGSYVAYVGSRSGNDFVVDQMFVTKVPDPKAPGTPEMVPLKTGLTDNKFKLEADNTISADTRKLLLADAKAPRNPADGTVVNLVADIAKVTTTIQQKSTAWFKDVLGMADPSQFDAAKAGSITTSAKNAAEDSVKALPPGADRTQKAQKAELDNLKKGSDALSAIADAGVGLRKRFDELTKFDLGIKGDPNPDEKAALDKAWREFVDKNQTPNLKDLDQLDAGKLVKLSKELEEQLSNKQSIAAVREMGAKPGKVIDAAKLDVAAGTDDVPAQAITQFRSIADLKDAKSNQGKKFIVVTEGDRTAVYIGKDETSGEGADKKTAFKVEKSMLLQDGKWVEGKDAAGTMLAYQEGKADEITPESTNELKEKTKAMSIARADTGMAPKDEFGANLDAFVNAIALAETRFPPSDKPAMKPDTDDLLVQRPDVPDLLGRGNRIG